MKKDICNLSFDELCTEIKAIGEVTYRAGQIFEWIYKKNADSFKEMTNLSGKLAQRLEDNFYISKLNCTKHLTSKDGTEKFLWKLEDGNHIETAFMKEGKRKTLCLSTQVGCRFKCPFCASGEKGLIRNLTLSEMVNQVRTVEKICNCRITNVVFMGIGEPLDNYENLLKSIKVLNHPKGLNIGARKITVSTCGIIPEIKKLKDERIQVELSVSLHAGNDSLRNELVPINRKYSLGKLISVLKDYYLTTSRVVTLEYTLIRGKNDSLKDAKELLAIAKELKAKVNLITCNPAAGMGVERPKPDDVNAFRDILRSGGVAVTIRKIKGADIKAACGQLAFK
jgi:23S rRNA (adenine2503-C2)-methyltransferase